MSAAKAAKKARAAQSRGTGGEGRSEALGGEKTGEKTGSRIVTSPLSGGQMLSGNHPQNTGGKPGRSGRPPQAFKAFLAAMRTDPAVQQALEDTLKDPGSKHWASALKVIVDYDEDLPANQMTPEQRIARLAELERIAREREAAATT